MAPSSSPVSEVADRYAQSLFDLARGNDAIETVESELDGFRDLIDGNRDVRRLIESPAFTAGEQLKGVQAIVESAGPSPMTGNFLKVVARNRRLSALPGMIRRFKQLATKHRGKVEAEVTTAREMNEDERNELKDVLGSYAGKTVTLRERVDPAILGGLIVQIGSRMVDTSIRTKLNSLKLALKEVG